MIANANFGFQVSEWGTGFTWVRNSRMHQVTPWSNDPVRDPAFEHYLLQDPASRALLPLTPAGQGARGEDQVRHEVRHQVRHQVPIKCATAKATRSSNAARRT